MINFSFNVRNPWGRDLPMHDYVYKHKTLSKNKSFELQISRCSTYNLFRLFVDFSWRGEDHAGPTLEVELGRYFFNAKIYDHRHWDYKKGTWETDSEEVNND